jgi:glucokinase
MSAPSLTALPFPVLIGDIGGTNARFALVEDALSAHRWLGAVHTADFATIDDAIAAKVFDEAGTHPRSAVLALAGPITGDRVTLTNCDWIVEPKRSIARFGFDDMALLNDFEALSLCLPDLQPSEIDPIGDGTRRPDGIKVVLGPGTGLGVGALVPVGDMWVPIPGEGPHIDLGPVTARDMAIWPHLERVHGRITAEAILSGAGMYRLYRAICAADGVSPRQPHQEEVTAAGLAGTDAQAVETLSLFATHLGRVAGDLALIFLAYGGVYLGGGISGKIASVLKSGAFREAFTAKAPYDRIVSRIATSIIARPDAALAGIAAFARTPQRFSVNLSQRHWRKPAAGD